MSKKQRNYLGLVVVIILIGSALVLSYLKIWPFGGVNSNRPVYLGGAPQRTASATADPDSFRIVEADQVAFTTEVVTEGLEVPWSIVFTSSERMLVSERAGRIREIINGELTDEPVYVFEEIGAVGEAGAMGMVLDPDFSSNKYIYVCYSMSVQDGLIDRVVRFADQGSSLSNMRVIVDDIPAGRNHAGCELAFGPDGKLYITTGDAMQGELAQDLESLAGKILRVNADGSIPSDNPFPNSPVWSYGHRNAQGLDWYPGTEILYASEHGPSGFDGPGGGDEINLIEKGKNYGWPEVSHEETASGMEDPKITFTPAIAPASALFLESSIIPEFENNFFTGMLRGEGIMRFVMDPENPNQIIMYERLPAMEFGRIRDLALGPDGMMYFTTSNTDGRGRVLPGDDKIIRIMPFVSDGG